MRGFEYASPTTKEQAVSLLDASASALAGGTDLLSLMKDDILAPRRLVNLKEIAELRGIRPAGSGLRIGALVTIQELLDNPLARRLYPSLTQAAEGITSPQIRSQGTVGGDLCQRPRCWYYRAGFGLLAKAEDGSSLVPDGDNRYHAILGNAGPAYFVNPSSLAPALIALGAKVHLFGSGGMKEMNLENFFAIPSSADEKEYRLKAGEIVTEIIIPPYGTTRNATYEVRQKEALDWPLAAASVALKMKGKTVETAAVVLGHVAPVPWRAPAAEAFLSGKTITEATAEQAGSLAVSGAKALSRNGYKIQLARVAVKRALLRAAEGGR
jgi:xanthine dehydrogenase YagS FAD-binding subunit